MLQYSFDLYTKTPRQDGTYPLKVKIYRTRTDYIYIALKIYLLPVQWDGKKIVNTVTASIDNARLNNYRVSIGKVLLEIDESGEIPPMSEIRARVEKSIGQKQQSPERFFGYCENYVSKVKTKSTRKSFLNTISKISKFDRSDKSFSQITPGWLRDFERYCKDTGMSINGINVYMRNIRTIYNRAIDDNVAQSNDYPFRRFKIRKESTQKRALTVEQLRQLRDHTCEPYQEKYRDIFMLIFYLGGINLIDMFNLKDMPDGRVDYKRSKTGVHVSLKVQPEAMKIIERYKSEKHLLSMADRYSNYENFLHRMDKELKKIGTFEMVENAAKDPMRRKKNKKNITPLFPKLSTYWARHSVATLMAELDIPDATIDRVLAHSDNSIAAIYIKRNRQKVDEAMRKVIDYVNG